MVNTSVVLLLDSSDSTQTRVELEVGGHRFKKTASSGTSKSQAILPLIEAILKDQKLKLGDITEIRVATGPGSFTGLRVGAAVAQALGILLGTPVNNKPPGSPLDLVYTPTKYS